jgi:hypothetical protein
MQNRAHIHFSPLISHAAAAAPLCYLARLHCVCAAAAASLTHAAAERRERAINLLFLSIVGSARGDKIGVCAQEENMCCLHRAQHADRTQIYIFFRSQSECRFCARKFPNRADSQYNFVIATHRSHTNKSQTARAESETEMCVADSSLCATQA